MAGFSLPPELIHVAFGVGGTLFGYWIRAKIDYRKDKRLQKEKREQQRRDEIREWKTTVRRIVGIVEQRYSTMDASDSEERNSMRDTVQEMIESLQDLDDAPSEVDDDVILQIQKVIDASKNLDDEVWAMSARISTNNKNPFSSGRRRKKRSDSREEQNKKHMEQFNRQMESILTEIEKLNQLLSSDLP